MFLLIGAWCSSWFSNPFLLDFESNICTILLFQIYFSIATLICINWMLGWTTKCLQSHLLHLYILYLVKFSNSPFFDHFTICLDFPWFYLTFVTNSIMWLVSLLEIPWLTKNSKIKLWLFRHFVDFYNWINLLSSLTCHQFESPPLTNKIYVYPFNLDSNLRINLFVKKSTLIWLRPKPNILIILNNHPLLCTLTLLHIDEGRDWDVEKKTKP